MNKIKKIIVGTLLTTLILINTDYIIASSLSNKKNKASNIGNQIEDNNKKIKNAEEQADVYLAEVVRLNKEIGKYENNLNELQGKVDEVNQKIKGYEDSLQNSAQKYNSAEDMYTTRLRAIYENGMPSVIDLFFQSEGIIDFFSKMNVYQGILEYDKSLVGNVKNEKEYINNIKEDIEVQKLQLDQLKYDMEKSTNALNNVKAQKQGKANELKKSKETLENVNNKLENERKKLNMEIEAEIARIEEEERRRQQQGSATVVVPSKGIFMWPLKGYGKNRLTAGFPCYPDGTRHDGIDLGVPIGTPVYAAADGRVTKSKFYLTGNYDGGYRDGYGNYVMIYHGDYTTIYGHMKFNKVVSAGQNVKKGDLIGYSASTGNSTGPHLHFEVRRGRRPVNPLQFF